MKTSERIFWAVIFLAFMLILARNSGQGLLCCPFQSKEVSSQEAIPVKVEEKQWVIGFCPTMKEYADELVRKNPDLKIETLPNTAVVLDLLKAGKIDAGLIGRKARKSEISSRIRVKRMKDGWTLVSSYPRVIRYDALIGETVHTYLNEALVREFLPEKTPVIFYPSKEDAFRFGVDAVVLADWNDVPEDYHLLIPVENGKKVPRFRAPVLYVGDAEIFNILIK